MGSDNREAITRGVVLTDSEGDKAAAVAVVAVFAAADEFVGPEVAFAEFGEAVGGEAGGEVGDGVVDGGV